MKISVLFICFMSLFGPECFAKTGQIDLHHCFPQQYRIYFMQKGIPEIDLYTIPLPKREHDFLTYKYKWNNVWGAYIAAHPVEKYKLDFRLLGSIDAYSNYISINAAYERKILFHQLGIMFAEAGIARAVFYDYKTRKPTGETLGKIRFKEVGMSAASAKVTPRKLMVAKAMLHLKPVIAIFLFPLLCIAPLLSLQIAGFLDSWPVVISLFVVETGLWIVFLKKMKAATKKLFAPARTMSIFSTKVASVGPKGWLVAAAGYVVSAALWVWGIVTVAYPYLELLDKMRRSFM